MRDRALESLAGRHFDLIVVGAGVNGAGIARDGAMRGLSVLLLDKGDLSAGTTQWSTRLVHGGLRYLEHAEIGLVRESLHERERLLHVAGHLVRPLPMVIPIYESDRRGPRLIRLGMAAYDALSLRKSLDHHHVLSVEDLLEREPGLVPDGLMGGALYYDAQVEFPERLVVENALSARDEGALVLTYASVERILVEENVARGVEVRDRLGGGTHTARGEVVVNAAGPWVDEVLGGVPRHGPAPDRRHQGESRGGGALPGRPAERPLPRGRRGCPPVLRGALERPLPDRDHRLPLRRRPRPRRAHRGGDRLPPARDQPRAARSRPRLDLGALRLRRGPAAALRGERYGRGHHATAHRPRPRARPGRGTRIDRRGQAHDLPQPGRGGRRPGLRASRSSQPRLQHRRGPATGRLGRTVRGLRHHLQGHERSGGGNRGAPPAHLRGARHRRGRHRRRRRSAARAARGRPGLPGRRGGACRSATRERRPWPTCCCGAR
ncbi:MAG: FAD-dependent oxidoreductase [Thermoleophilaceae bacterium]